MEVETEMRQKKKSIQKTNNLLKIPWTDFTDFTNNINSISRQSNRSIHCYLRIVLNILFCFLLLSIIRLFILFPFILISLHLLNRIWIAHLNFEYRIVHMQKNKKTLNPRRYWFTEYFVSKTTSNEIEKQRRRWNGEHSGLKRRPLPSHFLNYNNFPHKIVLQLKFTESLSFSFWLQ